MVNHSSTSASKAYRNKKPKKKCFDGIKIVLVSSGTKLLCLLQDEQSNTICT